MSHMEKTPIDQFKTTTTLIAAVGLFSEVGSTR